MAYWGLRGVFSPRFCSAASWFGANSSTFLNSALQNTRHTP